MSTPMTDTTSLRELPAKWQADAFAVVAAYGPGSDYGQALQMCIDELEAALSARAEPQAGEWEPTARELLRRLETAQPPNVLMQQLTILGDMAALLRCMFPAAPSPASRVRPEAQGEDDAKLVDALADHAYSDAADGRSCPSDATEQAREALIRRLAALEAQASAPGGEVTEDARRWAFYVHAMTDESGIAREAIRRQAFPAHTKEAWDACIDKAMAEVVLPEAANEAAIAARTGKPGGKINPGDRVRYVGVAPFPPGLEGTVLEVGRSIARVHWDKPAVPMAPFLIELEKVAAPARATGKPGQQGEG